MSKHDRSIALLACGGTAAPWQPPIWALKEGDGHEIGIGQVVVGQPPQILDLSSAESK